MSRTVHGRDALRYLVAAIVGAALLSIGPLLVDRASYGRGVDNQARQVQACARANLDRGLSQIELEDDGRWIALERRRKVNPLVDCTTTFLERRGRTVVMPQGEQRAFLATLRGNRVPPPPRDERS